MQNDLLIKGPLVRLPYIGDLTIGSGCIYMQIVVLSLCYGFPQLGKSVFTIQLRFSLKNANTASDYVPWLFPELPFFLGKALLYHYLSPLPQLQHCIGAD